ncbi:MAG: hypothetical protein PHO66_04370 [Eubacteriales bacterium]|nr:hypothetical protein [Eubacteriales bacterium]
MMTRKDTLVYSAGVLLFLAVLLTAGMTAATPPAPAGFALQQQYTQLWGYELPGCQNSRQALQELNAVCAAHALSDARITVRQNEQGLYFGSIKTVGSGPALLFSPYATGYGASYWAALTMDAAARRWMLDNLLSGKDYRVEYEDATTCIVSYYEGGRLWQAAVRSQQGGVRYTIATPALDGDF